MKRNVSSLPSVFQNNELNNVKMLQHQILFCVFPEKLEFCVGSLSSKFNKKNILTFSKA